MGLVPVRLRGLALVHCDRGNRSRFPQLQCTSCPSKNNLAERIAHEVGDAFGIFLETTKVISQSWKYSFPLFICLALPFLGCCIYLAGRPAPLSPVVVPVDALFSATSVRTEIRPDVDHLYRQTAFHEDGVTPSIVKHCFVNDRGNFLHLSGNYVVYDYFRQDGTLEKMLRVSPSPQLNASIICKQWMLLFAADGKTETYSAFYRADGTLGADGDNTKNVHTQYRLDGVTPRWVQTYDGKDYHFVYLRKDGITKWWEMNYGTGQGVVYCDRDGHAIHRTFIYKNLSGSYSMGYDDPPKETEEYTYLRDDGTVEYRQVWCDFYDKDGGDFCDALLRVDVFAPDGKTKVRALEFEPRRHTAQLFIKRAVTFNEDGTRLMRTYSAPGTRSREYFFERDATLKLTSFGPKDASFEEPVDPVWLQGFGPALNLYGYDTDFNDQ